MLPSQRVNNKYSHLFQQVEFEELPRQNNKDTDVVGSDDVDEVAKRPWFMRGGQAYPSESALSRMFPEDAPGDDR